MHKVHVFSRDVGAHSFRSTQRDFCRRYRPWAPTLGTMHEWSGSHWDLLFASSRACALVCRGTEPNTWYLGLLVASPGVGVKTHLLYYLLDYLEREHGAKYVAAAAADQSATHFLAGAGFRPGAHNEMRCTLTD